MQILESYDLTKLNTFGIKAEAKYFTEINKEQDIPSLFESEQFKNNERLFLGGGSNVLFTHDFNGIVILNKIKGIEVINETQQDVWIKAYGGEMWHDLVLFAVGHEYWGIENLSWVPGTVGAAPMQNIGAYGAELKDTLVSVEAFDISTGEKVIFQNNECKLGYRDSIFKNIAKGKYFIGAIVLKLSKLEKKNITYRALKDYFEKNNINPETIKDISDAVIEIRKSKLPDPKIIGNAGSFFKNVFVEKKELDALLEKYPELPYFEEENVFKIPAGWLIEECGPAGSGISWKGYRVGSVGVHDKQALVLVNHGGATGEEIKDLALQIIESVKQKFGLILTPEVNFV